jgi:uncharacterized membrane protein YadS
MGALRPGDWAGSARSKKNLLNARKGDGATAAAPSHSPSWVPWFMPGFLLFATLRSLDLVPDGAIIPIAKTAGFLSIVSMAALGLGVDLTPMYGSAAK